MMSCAVAGCGAEIDGDGYCTRCGMAAKAPNNAQPITAAHPPSAPPLSASPSAGQSVTGPSVSGPSVSGPSARALISQPTASQTLTIRAHPDSLFSLPPVEADAGLAPVLEDPQVPERKRFCPNPGCHHPVGRARDGRPGRVEGFCPQCRTRFSFRPPLQPGQCVGDGQFEVEGAIAHGGLGWVYRAWDRWVPRRVVLKGLIDPDDPDTRQAAVDEMMALADADHPNIVKVHTVVKQQHPLTGSNIDYIVMEYLSGRSLRQLLHERPDTDPGLPVDQVCGFGLEVLKALRYLHEKRFLLYCDLSANNVMHSPNGVKLIDLGAVRRIDDMDGPVWGKAGYQDPDIAIHGPCIGTDLYTVARLMAVLSFPFPGFATHRQGSLPPPDEVELLARYPSFYGLLRRATNPDPQRRFASAAEMAEQLEGVLREVRAQQTGYPFPGTSTRFGPELRVVGADPDTFPAGRLDTVAAALALPDPQVNPADPHAGLLVAISAERVDEIERALAALPDPSPETRLRLLRTRIELGRREAGHDLDAMARDQPEDWRVCWYRGLLALVNQNVGAAESAFADVLDALPGEAAPKLALALCSACEGDATQAERGYATVWQTDRSYVSAAFGLARARYTLGDLAGSAAAVEAVPDNSRYAVTARLCAILARARGRAPEQPPVADFFAAAERLATLDLDERRRALTTAEVLESVLSWENARRPWPHGKTTPIPEILLGHPLNERGVRSALEAAYRKLARLASTTAEKISFVDRANEYRNRSWL